VKELHIGIYKPNEFVRQNKVRCYQRLFVIKDLLHRSGRSHREEEVRRQCFLHPRQSPGFGSVIVNSAGALVTRQYYQPFGADDAIGTSVGEVDYHKFTGQEQVASTGLYYYGGRFYAPELGRFISADPFVGMNRYAYCGNDPVNNTDPTGYDILGIGAWINDQSSADKCNARYMAMDKALIGAAAPIEGASSASSAGGDGYQMTYLDYQYGFTQDQAENHAKMQNDQNAMVWNCSKEGVSLFKVGTIGLVGYDLYKGDLIGAINNGEEGSMVSLKVKQPV